MIAWPSAQPPRARGAFSGGRRAFAPRRPPDPAPPTLPLPPTNARPPPGPRGGPGFDAAGVFKSEKAAWEAVPHEWALEGAEREALAVLRRRAAEA